MTVNDPANRLANKINDIVDSKIRKRTKTASLIKSAKVVKVDTDGTPWVSISGSDQETPVNGEILANAKVGDSVSVSIENGKCNILGNVDDPSIGSTAAKDVSNQEIKNAVEQDGVVGRAIDVGANKALDQVDGMISDQLVPIEESIDDLDLKSGEDIRILRGRTASSVEIANSARTMADVANTVAEEAQAVATATGQHFWHDDDGAHVTEITQEQWTQAQTGHNILINSLGILLRKALNYIATWTGTAIAFYDGGGNQTSNMTAQFGGNGLQLGKTGESHVEMDYHSLKLIDKGDKVYLYVSDLRESNGYFNVVETLAGNGVKTYFDLTYDWSRLNSVTVSDSSGGAYSLDYLSGRLTFESAPSDGAIITVDYRSFTTKAKVFTFGNRKSASVVGGMSAAFGYDVEASGTYSFAEGNDSKATGYVSHSEGYQSVASGRCAHAEGSASTASGDMSHAEGGQTIASGTWAHAEGYGSEASGSWSHAQNRSTIAQGYAQTAIGKLNIADTTSAFIIGNGVSTNTRSNAFTVDWSGNVEAAGDVIANGVVETNIIKYPNVEVRAPSTDLVIDIYDSSTGYPKYKWYMSTYGNFARQQYSNGSWGAANYYLVREDIHDLFSCSSISQTIGSVAAASTKTLTFSAARTGYDPIAISGWYMNGAAGLYPYMLRLSGSDIQCFVRNPTSSASSSTAKVEVQVLYCRSSW